MKKCTKCGEVKPKEMFYRNKHVADGYKTECKKCYDKRKSLKKSDYIIF